jgi:FAD dependent oxidoreductase TIGR03364
MHAVMALTHGAEVLQLERDPTPTGATVRNFGLVWVSGRAPGRELALAQRARDLWEKVAAKVPEIGFRANGSLTLLATEAEVAVAKRAMERSDAEERGFELVDAAEARRRNPGLRGEFLAGLWCARDAAVESRVALSALRSWMETSGRYQYQPGREVVGLSDHVVHDHRGASHRGDRVFICLGATLSGFGAELFADAPLSRVRLHMVETAPLGRELTTSVADGDSLRYYPAFAGDARELLGPQEGIRADFGVQLLCQQRLHGGLTVGDTHEPDDPRAFETRDEPVESILAGARSLIGGPFPAVERRWAGVYHQMRDPGRGDLYYRAELAAGVVAVTGAGGRGMTLAPAIAEESFE